MTSGLISNPILEAIAARRSVRKFSDEAVRREEVLTILEAGRMAPSGRNLQPCRFFPIFRGEPAQEALAQLTSYTKIVRTGQVLVAVCLDREAQFDPIKDCQSAGAAMQNMLLAAHSLGLGGLWIGQILGQEPAVLQVLQLPAERYQLMALLVFGRPAPDLGERAPRQPLSTFLLKSI